MLSTSDAMPSNTQLHRLMEALLGIQVQVNAPLHARLWDDHQHVPLDISRAQRCLRPPWSGCPDRRRQPRAQQLPAPVVTVTIVVPPWPWIAIVPAAVTKFKYLTVWVAHKCPGHPYRGPLYYSLHAMGTLPAELHPALKTHLREHHGDLALLAPHGLATNPPPPPPPQGLGSQD